MSNDAKNFVISEELAAIRDAIVKAVPAQRIYLFGSYARGEQTPDSDYDIYIVLSDCELLPQVAIKNVLLAIKYLPRKTALDILAGSTDKFNKRITHYSIERTINKEGVVIYEQQ